MSSLAALPVAVPFAAAAILLVIRALLSRRITDLFAIGVGSATTAICIVLATGLRFGEIFWSGGWVPRDGFSMGVALIVDTFATSLCVLASLLTTASFAYAWHYFPHAGARFQALMLLFLGGMNGFMLSGDLFNQFVFFELMSVAAFALTGYKLDEPSLIGAITFTISNSLGGFLFLFGIALLYGATGALNMREVGETLSARPADNLVLIAMALLVVGYLVKGAAVPFHFWLPEAHTVSPTPVSVLFSGIMVPLGFFGLARVLWSIFVPGLGDIAERFGDGLVVLGALTALLGAGMSLLQHHLKRLLAFSTISHGGVVLMGIGLMDTGALAGALLYAFAHGLIKGSLFMATGNLLHRHGSVDEYRLQGRGRAMKLTGLIFFAGALGLAGVAPFGTFLGKSLIEYQAASFGSGWLIPVAMVASAVTAAAVLRAAARVFLGWGPRRDEDVSVMPREEKEEYPDPRTLRVMTIIAMMLLLLAMFGAFWTAAGVMAINAAQAFTASPVGTDISIIPFLLPMFGGLGLAFAISAFELTRPRWRRTEYLLNRLRPLCLWLRRVHQGPISEVVLWLMGGFVLLGMMAIWAS